jgi:hypothetical protein
MQKLTSVYRREVRRVLSLRHGSDIDSVCRPASPPTSSEAGSLHLRFASTVKFQDCRECFRNARAAMGISATPRSEMPLGLSDARNGLAVEYKVQRGTLAGTQGAGRLPAMSASELHDSIRRATIALWSGVQGGGLLSKDARRERRSAGQVAWWLRACPASSMSR